MGAKITIDSATLMNKGFEVIEARWLFDLPVERIGVLVHPESIVHSFVEYSDGSWLAQLGIPDMRIPIAYTLGMPERFPLPDLPPLDLLALGALHFEAPDTERFPALRIAFEALAAGGTAPAALNAANEVAVAAFLAREIPFTAIAETAEEVLAALPVLPGLSLAEIWEVDERARAHARRRIEERVH
jgi:1-deoxy-D-xylulose-5-phosphate reductoisomerase